MPESEPKPEMLSEEQKILESLKELSQEQNEMAIRFLAEKTGMFKMPGISFTLLGAVETDWQKMKLQINGPDQNVIRNFSFYKNDLERLARELAAEGLKPEQLDALLQTVQETASHLTKINGRWEIGQ